MKNVKRNNVLLVHGVFLLIVAAGNTISSLAGLNSGVGIFGFLKALPLAEVGLFQAYMLMLLVGFILLINTNNKDSWKYDIVGVLAHFIPLSALFIFYDIVKDTMGFKVVIASSLTHIPWIRIESITATIKYKQQYGKAV